MTPNEPTADEPTTDPTNTDPTNAPPPDAPDEVEVRDNPGRRRFDILVGGEQAGFSMYTNPAEDPDDQRIFYHTVIDDAFGGRGLAGILTRTALLTSVAEGHRVVAACPQGRPLAAQPRRRREVRRHGAPGASRGGAPRERRGGRRRLLRVIHRMDASAMVAFGVALRRDDVDSLEDRGAAVSAGHSHGRIYPAPERMIEHFQQLGPLNMSNAGAGEAQRRTLRVRSPCAAPRSPTSAGRSLPARRSARRFSRQHRLPLVESRIVV